MNKMSICHLSGPAGRFKWGLYFNEVIEHLESVRIVLNLWVFVSVKEAGTIRLMEPNRCCAQGGKGTCSRAQSRSHSGRKCCAILHLQPLEKWHLIIIRRPKMFPRCSASGPEAVRSQPPELCLKVCGFCGLNPATTTLSIRENDKRQISTTLMRVVITAGERAACSPPYEEVFTV